MNYDRPNLSEMRVNLPYSGNVVVYFLSFVTPLTDVSLAVAGNLPAGHFPFRLLLTYVHASSRRENQSECRTQSMTPCAVRNLM